MQSSGLSLLGARRFGPLFATQFLGAFNDNLYKTAMLFLITFHLMKGEDSGALIAIAGGVFILPFFLFSGLAGQLADSHDKTRLTRIIKAAEIGIMVAGALALSGGPLWLLMATLFAMGTHSAFFGPIKYAILPQHLDDKELLNGTGLIEAGTFLAILLGQILGGLLSPAVTAWVTVAAAVIGYISARQMPPAPPETQDRIDWNLWAQSIDLVRSTAAIRPLLLSSVGISWFFAVGVVFTSLFAPLVQAELNATPAIATLFLAIFSVGIAVGSLLVNRLLKGAVSAQYAPAAALALTVFILDLCLAVTAYNTPGTDTVTLRQFVQMPDGWHMMFALFGIAVTGGVFVVPLYAILQTAGPAAERSRHVAANNILNAAFMVAAAAISAVLLMFGLSTATVFLILGLANLVVAVIICGLLPDALIKSLLRVTLRALYGVEVKGLEHYEQAGERAVVVVNHVSFIDGLLLAAFLPDKPTFAVNTFIARQWWVRPFLHLIDAFPVDPTNPMAVKAMVRAVKDGRKLVIFPEGRITVTGALMKVFEGPGMVADKAEANIIPCRIEGAQYSPFSRLRGKVRTRWFPSISLTFLPPQRIETGEGLSARQRRQVAGQKLYDLMSDLIFRTTNIDKTLYRALLDAAATHGAGTLIVEDINRSPLSYRKLIAGSLVLGRVFKRFTARREAVGILLPNVNSMTVAFFALQAIGRVPAMLNFTAGPSNLKAACTAAQVRTVITARAFVQQAKLETTVEALGANVVYLEDIAASLRTWDRLRGLLLTPFAGLIHAAYRVAHDEIAVVLFTSGSEGLPKGVALTHRNIIANCTQIAARIDFNPTDIVFNALPTFHSFGLTDGTLLPVFSGLKVFLYPSPLHYRIVPALIYDTNATILFGTDTFLNGYSRMAHPYDLYSVRYVFAGAEKVRDQTRQIWAEKFGLRLFEGYGVTEASPVIAVNTPMHVKAGTVGRLLPGIEPRLEPITGIEQGGRLHVRGPNIMAGYYKADRPGVLQPPADGWHDTGDIVTIDDAGYVTIAGRAKRFAKIGGEMVSLTAVESYAARAWPGYDHAVVTRPDPRKGEQLVLFTTNPDATTADLLAWGRAHGVTELMLPRDIRPIEALPVLGTGKLDYVAINRMAQTPAEQVEPVLS